MITNSNQARQAAENSKEMAAGAHSGKVSRFYNWKQQSETELAKKLERLEKVEVAFTVFVFVGAATAIVAYLITDNLLNK